MRNEPWWATITLVATALLIAAAMIYTGWTLIQ